MRTRTIAVTFYSQVLYTQALTRPHDLHLPLSFAERTNKPILCAHARGGGVGTYDHASAQYVQVHRRGLGEALEHAVDLLDVQPHVGLPLPAAQHQVVDLFRTGAGPLQHAALGDALNHLQGDSNESTGYETMHQGGERHGFYAEKRFVASGFTSWLCGQLNTSQPVVYIVMTSEIFFLKKKPFLGSRKVEQI